MNPGYYEKLHADNQGKTSLSTEEIEKDLLSPALATNNETVFACNKLHH